MVNLRQRKMFQIMICVRASPIYLRRGYVIATGFRVTYSQTLYFLLTSPSSTGDKINCRGFIDRQRKGLVVGEFSRSACIVFP